MIVEYGIFYDQGLSAFRDIDADHAIVGFQVGLGNLENSFRGDVRKMINIVLEPIITGEHFRITKPKAWLEIFSLLKANKAGLFDRPIDFSFTDWESDAFDFLVNSKSTSSGVRSGCRVRLIE